MRYLLLISLVLLYGCEKSIKVKHEDIVYLFCGDRSFSITEDYDRINYHHEAFAVVSTDNLSLIDHINFSGTDGKEDYSVKTKYVYPWRTNADTSIKKNGEVIVSDFIEMVSNVSATSDSYIWSTKGLSYLLERNSLFLFRKLKNRSVGAFFDCKMFDEQTDFEAYSSEALAEYSKYANKVREQLKSKRKL